jgi:hypothetical protein
MKLAYALKSAFASQVNQNGLTQSVIVQTGSECGGIFVDECEVAVECCVNLPTRLGGYLRRVIGYALRRFEAAQFLRIDMPEVGILADFELAATHAT